MFIVITYRLLYISWKVYSLSVKIEKERFKGIEKERMQEKEKNEVVRKKKMMKIETWHKKRERKARGLELGTEKAREKQLRKEMQIYEDRSGRFTPSFQPDGSGYFGYRSRGGYDGGYGYY